MNKYLDISPEVKAALDEGRPVVALESTIISHGMPYPKNVETALLVEQTIRDNGAVPQPYSLRHDGHRRQRAQADRQRCNPLFQIRFLPDSEF